ncbi:MAG: hypothetical protein IJX34_02445 [Clostridia bacterium]|nr:hypothetical protein [Clostridia bacterium]
MRKVKIFTLIILCVLMLGLNNVYARLQSDTIDVATMMLDENSIVINTDYSKVNLVDAVVNSSGVSRKSDLTVSASEHRVYTMYDVWDKNASVTMTYRNIGYVNSGPNAGKKISADMTISGLKMGNGSRDYANGQIGFNKYYMGFVLFESTQPDGSMVRGSVAKITVKFFYTDEPKQYINIGSMYMGIGGFNSEKLVPNGSDPNTLGAPQWEWVSFDNTDGNATTYGLRDTSCLIKQYAPGWTGTASDYDGNTVTYPYAVGAAHSYTNTSTGNVTGRTIISNGGNRYPQILEVMADDYATRLQNYNRYRERIKSGFWMFTVPTIQEGGRTISQFQFEFGKSFGTVELGLKPVLLANHFPAQPSKTVDKKVAREKETLTYTVNQRTGFLQQNAQNQTQFDNADTVNKYNSMSIIDELPNEVEFVAGSIKLRRGNTYLTQGTDYTISGPTTNAAGRKEIAVNFTRDYLQNRMQYVGETYSMEFKATVKDLTYAQAESIAYNQSKIYIAVNGARTIINGTSANSNKVETQIIFDILTQSIKATISNMITEIKGGADNQQVTFTPDLGYYIDSVEWQTQADRYAPSTQELVNVKEIPSTNKVKIPEVKDGTENTYKHETTMTGNIPASEKDTLNYDPFGTTIYTFNNIDNNHYVKVIAKPMKMVINISKEDIETGKTTQGDATLEGAQYTIFSNEACTTKVETVTLDANGNGTSSELPLGKYYVKETVAPTGYLLDENVYVVVQTAEQQTAQRLKVSYHDVTSKDEVIRNDIEIIKNLEKTDSTEKQSLAGAVFSATLNSDPTKVYYSSVTDETGYCIITELPYGTYTIRETTIPDTAYNGEFYVGTSTARVTTFEQFIEVDNSTNDPYRWGDITDVAKKMQIKIYKEDSVTGTQTQGDAKLEGAEYTLYRDEACTDPVETIVIRKQADGTYSATSGWYLVGTYYVKETKAPEGYLIDETVYTVAQNPAEQTEEHSYHSITSKDEVMKGRVIVTKYDNKWNSTEDSPSAGAILRLTLDSNPDTYYEVTLDKHGNGEFYNDVLKDFAPYTIPYGKYTVTEIKESDASEGTHYFIQPEGIDLTDEGDKDVENRIFDDEPVPMRLHIIKTDAVKGHAVEIAGAKFKIWDLQNDCWVKQNVVYPSNIETEVFETNETGELYTPEQLAAGEYIVYEVEAPAGYMLNPEWAIPENESDIGKKDKGGKYVKVDKVAMGIANNTPAADLDLYYDVEMPNQPLMGKLEITKMAEVLSDVTTTSVGEWGEKYTPVYVQKGLPGVTYDIIAAEDIKSPDGVSTYVNAGTIVATITTGENGIAETPDLYLGEYKIVETSVPAGYIIDNNIENVVLENNTKDEAVVTTEKEVVNPRQKLKLTFKKEFEDIDFEFDGDIVATFGVYANQDIKNAEGQVVIPQDGLIDIIEYTKSEEDDITSTIDLPAGKYYVRELQVSYPYTKSEETVKVELTHDGSQNEFLTFEASKMVNTFNSTTLSLIKLPTTIVEDIIVDSEGVVDTEFDEVTAQILEEIKGLTKEELKVYFEDMGWIGLQGAEYEVYIDAECQRPLKMDGEPVTLVSDELGMMVLEDIPVGVYYLKETKAPAKYEVTEEVIKIETTLQDKDVVAYRVVREDSVIEAEIQKVDIFTGEAVPNCVFEIYDENENVLMHSITDEVGVGRIAANLFEDGKTYYFKEISAPAQYHINTEMQKFVAEFDENGEWVSNQVRVDNTRKNIEELIVRKVDDKTGDPLQGCKFSIIVLDENGEPVLDENGENVYLVKEAVTDENGEYIVEKPFYGFYQFIEVEAPEGYELKVDMEGMTFVIDENSPETVIFEVTNTGDIAVYALTAMALVSMLGIAYVVRKNKLAVK